MKTKPVMALLAVVLVGANLASAADEKKTAGSYPALVAASEIKGTGVKNLKNEDLGKIEEVLIEPDGGQVRFVVVEVGGFLGLGATKVAVPWTAFQLSKDGNKPKWVLDADKERLKNAPKVEGKNYERLYTRAAAEPVFVYWRIIWVEPSPSTSISPSLSSSPSPSPSP
ncbi:MAG TPA: PRC-barrel domain-containing protein [Chthoniobacterales bacterium]|nr:PRC-barrel domain-containing protein [Chthoniobacterales bacterium]